MKKTQWTVWLALVELLLAAMLWGFGFIASAWALEAINPFELTLLRFLLAGAVGLPFLFHRSVRGQWRTLLALSFLPAVFLAGTLQLQTWGLKFTTATKSGFITTLYVIFVPLLESLLSRRNLPRGIWACVGLAFVGTALIVNIGVSDINFGDLLTLGCAIVATGQIYWMGVVSPRIKHPFAFNIFQCLWSIALALPFVQWSSFGPKVLAFQSWSSHAFWGVMSLAFGSTMIAFFLQVRAQAKLSATTSSVMFLLESPFALIFAVMLLGEHLSSTEAVGAVLIFVSALLATWLESRAEARVG